MLFYSYLVIVVVINEVSGYNELDSTKMAIKAAGCPFHNKEQLLLNNVCLMPHYEKNNPPENSNGITIVDIDWVKVPQILDVDERKNRITIQLQQYMEWVETRVMVNFSAMKNLKHITSWLKFSPSIVEKIWHPNIDMHTFDLQEWKSLYDPLWFQSVGINKCPMLRYCEIGSNSSHFYADKRWSIVLFCKFNFSSFPFDTQHCDFRQSFESTSETVKLFQYPLSSTTWQMNITKGEMNLNYVESGFEVFITPVGDTIIPDTRTQNSSESEYGFNIELRRLVQPYLFQYYFPSAAIVVVSQISYVIPLSSIPGRVGLVVTQFLTLTNVFIHQMVSSKLY